MTEGRVERDRLLTDRLKAAPCVGCGTETLQAYCPDCDPAVDRLLAAGYRFADGSITDWQQLITEAKA